MGLQFTLLEKIDLILADLLDAESLGRAVEVSGETANRADLGACGSLGVITALEFLEHPFAKLGHRDLLVTHTLSSSRHGRIPCVRVASAARAA